MSLQRPISAAAAAAARAQSAAALASANANAASSGPFSAKEKALRADPTLARSFRGHHGAVLSVAYSPVLTRAADTGLPGYASAEADPSNAIGGTASSRARAQKAASSFVQQLASGGADHVVMLWHLRPQLRAFRFLGHSGPVNCVSFSADGKLLASGSDDHTVRVWTPSAEGKSIVLRGHVARVNTVVWASDNRWLLSTSDDQQCKLWDVSTGAAHSHFHGHTGAVTCAAFSPDMRLVATGSSDRTVKLFDVSTQSCIQTFYQNTGAITCVQFHPFGNVLATGCADHSIKLLDLRSNQLLQHYSAHDLAVSSIAFHPTGNFLLSSSLDSSIRLWDLRKGHQLYTIHGHPSPVHSAAFNHDGSQFVTGGADQRVITWNTNLDTKSTKNSALPKVGHAEAALQSKRGAMLASQVPEPLHPSGFLGRNRVEAGKRDAFYESRGLTSGPEQAAAASSSAPPPSQLPMPQPSGPLPPTEMRSASPPAPVGRDAVLFNSRRRGPPPYTFRTGEQAGQVIGGGHLYVDDGSGASAQAAASGGVGGDASAPPAEECCPPHNGLGTCDYTHSHISRSSGLVHSYADAHDERLVSLALQRAREEEQKYPGGPPGIEAQPLEAQMRGFHIPGLTQLAETGRASTRAGLPGPSPQQQQPGVLGGGSDGAAAGEAPLTARSAAQQAQQPSFAAAAAGVESNQVHASILSARGGARSGGSGSALPGPTALQQDEFVYSFQSDRFVPSSAYPNQAKTSEARALLRSQGVDIFAVPPADHVQRLPEQLAHAVKYITTQLDQISRAIHVFEYRMNLHEQKVDRLEAQQARWAAADGF